MMSSSLVRPGFFWGGGGGFQLTEVLVHSAASCELGFIHQFESILLASSNCLKSTQVCENKTSLDST